MHGKRKGQYKKGTQLYPNGNKLELAQGADSKVNCPAQCAVRQLNFKWIGHIFRPSACLQGHKLDTRAVELDRKTKKDEAGAEEKKGTDDEEEEVKTEERKQSKNVEK